jgi:hypothetical protein
MTRDHKPYHHVRAVIGPSTKDSLVELNGERFPCQFINIEYQAGGWPTVTLRFYSSVDVEAGEVDVKEVDE